MTLWPPVFNIALVIISCFEMSMNDTFVKTSRGLTNVLGHFLAIYNPLFGLRIQVKPRSSWKSVSYTHLTLPTNREV